MITVNTLQKMKAEGEKIAMLTAYESSFAALMDNAGVDVLLVGEFFGYGGARSSVHFAGELAGYVLPH